MSLVLSPSRNASGLLSYRLSIASAIDILSGRNRMATFHNVSPATTVCVGIRGLSATAGEIECESATTIEQHSNKIRAHIVAVQASLTFDQPIK